MKKRYLLLFLLLPFIFGFDARRAMRPDYQLPESTTTRPSIDIDGAMGDGTFARDGTPYYIDDDGIYQTITAQNLRHELIGGEHMAYLEPFHTNLVPWSSGFSNWTTSNVSISANVTGPDDSANSATTITDDNAGVADYIYIAVNPATDEEKYCYTAHIQEGTSADLTLILRDTGAAATRAEIDFEWSAGNLTVKTADTGTGAVKQIGSTDWWKAILYVPAATIVEANAHEVRIYPTENGRQAAETTIVWGVDLLEHAVDFRPIPTTGSPASINDEGGNPHYGLPTDTFAEALGGEELADPALNSAAAWDDSQPNLTHNEVAGTITWNGGSGYIKTTGGSGQFIVGTLYKISLTVDSLSTGSIRIQANNGAFQASGTNLTATGSVYRICTHDTDFWLYGDTTDAVISNISIKEVTNARNGKPVPTTLAYELYTGFAEADVSSDGAFISVADAVASVSYHDVSGNGLAAHDGTSEATKSLVFTANTRYIVATQWGELNSNVAQFRVCSDDGAGGAVTCGAWFDWDGAFPTGGNFFQIGNGLQGPFHIGKVKIWRRILGLTEIRTAF